MRGATVLAIAIVLYALLAGAAIKSARGHDWYPEDCCSGEDCAPVDNVSYVAGDPNALPLMVVSTKHGTISVPPNFTRRPSPDGRMHACIQTNEYGASLLCLFMPEGS